MPDTLTPEQIRYSHLVDDSERQRTHALRTIRRQNVLLDDALHAIRNGSYATAEEFVERALAALTAEADLLATRAPLPD
jgi:hypothetical protein